MNPQQASSNLTRNITTNGTTQITGRFVLIRIIVNTKGASSNTAKIYDSATTEENLIGTIDTTVTERTIECGYPVSNGIRIVTKTGTAPDLTIVYAEI